MWVAPVDFFGAKKVRLTILENILDAETLAKGEVMYYSFEPSQAGTEYAVNIFNHRYFLKPYITAKFRLYFAKKHLMTFDDFVQGLQVWTDRGVKHKYFREYEKISLRLVESRDAEKMELLIAFEGSSHTTLSPIEKLNLHGACSKFVSNGQLLRANPEVEINTAVSYPVLSYTLKKEMNFPFENSPSKNTYLEYFERITDFYAQHLRGKSIEGNIHISDAGFIALPESSVHKTKFVSNKLRFARDAEDNSVYNGLKKYGPYTVPETENLRFIFVYKQKGEHSNAAKKLYTSLQQGLKEGAFSPGLKDYLKINFKMADQHRIILDSNDPATELEKKLEEYPFDQQLNYFVIYLTDHRRVESEGDNEAEYYRIKYLLLQRGILSQFIFYKNILGSSFRYHLPNIQVAILAKIGGIPWKLDTFSSDKLIIGFGVKRVGENVFLGNSLFFREDGTFHKFDSFQNDSLKSIGAALKANIESVLLQGDLNVNKLVIHYYKTLNEEEAEEIEKVLKYFNLNIPYVVLTINDSKSRDFVFFDTMYDKIMPVSGTIVELKSRSEYLLSNNMRHDETQFYNIYQYPFPLKIKINRSNNVMYDVFDVKQLLDQVYSFSRIYWKSIGQASLPVTISYSKIVADLAAHFPENRLPENPVAHSNLWFL